MRRDEAGSSTSQSTVVSSVVVVNNKKAERSGEVSKARYQERVKGLDWRVWHVDTRWPRFWDLRVCRTRTAAVITVWTR